MNGDAVGLTSSPPTTSKVSRFLKKDPLINAVHLEILMHIRYIYYSVKLINKAAMGVSSEVTNLPGF